MRGEMAANANDVAASCTEGIHDVVVVGTNRRVVARDRPEAELTPAAPRDLINADRLGRVALLTKGVLHVQGSVSARLCRTHAAATTGGDVVGNGLRKPNRSAPVLQLRLQFDPSPLRVGRAQASTPLVT